MNRIVVYTSSTGFTKQYAEWIATACGCTAKEAKKVSESELAGYEQVIYGGWIMGNMIVGLDKIKKFGLKNLIIFAVGSSLDSEKLRNTIKEQNHITQEPFFYFEGGFRFHKIKLPMRMMLKIIKKSVAKKENKTPEDEYMAKILGTSFDNSSQEFIKSLVELAKSE